MVPSSRQRRPFQIAIILVSLLGVALFTMLSLWVLSLREPAESASEAYPGWYTDPFDTSWQVGLGAAPGLGPGLSSSRPVRVCGVHGELAYLASLLCEGDPTTPPFVDPFAVLDAERETVQRAFRARAVDRYEVPCASGPVEVFLSPYHCEGDVTGRVPPGFVPRFPVGS